MTISTRTTMRTGAGDNVDRLRSARGMALMAVMMLLMILSALGIAMGTSGRTELMVARNAETAAQAHAAAEAGLNHGVEVATTDLMAWQANGFASANAAINALLAGPDGDPLATADNGSLANFGIPQPPATLALPGTFNVTYEVRLFDEDDPARGTTLSAADSNRIGEAAADPNVDENSAIVIRSIGYAADNTRVTLEAILSNVASQLPALVVGGDLNISGNPNFIGTLGGAHANGDFDISGNPDMTGDATASGDYTVSGSVSVAGQSGGGYASVPIPPVSAIAYKPNADFILQSNGIMTDGSGNPICDASSDNSECRDAGYWWTYDGPNGWSISSNTDPDGTFYVEGDATLSGNLGSNADPAEMTIIAEGSIQISGNSDLVPHTPELMFVTDGDLKIAGQLDMPLTVEGAILVHEQIQISGNPTLSGQIIVEDSTSVSTLVTQNDISGNATISYNGTLGGGGVTTFSVSAWREVR